MLIISQTLLPAEIQFGKFEKDPSNTSTWDSLGSFYLDASSYNKETFISLQLLKVEIVNTNNGNLL